MNKGEFIDAVAEKAEVSKKDADAIVTAMVEAIMERRQWGKGWARGLRRLNHEIAHAGRSQYQNRRNAQDSAATVPGFLRAKGSSSWWLRVSDWLLSSRSAASYRWLWLAAFKGSD